MFQQRLSTVATAFVLSIFATVLMLALMLSFFGPGQIPGLYASLSVSGLGIMAAIWWFSFLGLRALTARLHPGPVRGRLGRVSIAAISCVLAAVGILSTLVTQHGCVCLAQRVEASRMNFTCGQVRQIEAACARLLSDSGKSDFHALFAESSADAAPRHDTRIRWNKLVPELLRKGRNADAPLDPNVRKRLAETYYLSADAPVLSWWRPLFSNPFPPDSLVDMWGRDFEFFEPTPPDTVPPICSLGRDGVPSSDDIRRDFLPEMDQDLVAFDFYDAAPINRTPFGRLYSLLTGRKWLTANENILHRE